MKINQKRKANAIEELKGLRDLAELAIDCARSDNVERALCLLKTARNIAIRAETNLKLAQLN